jgi:hypothetical protein
MQLTIKARLLGLTISGLVFVPGVSDEKLEDVMGI